MTMNELLSENEIMRRVQANWNKPVVSFLCTSFNQKDYIEQTIKGFLIQETTFPYEIMIHDDNSTDGTKDIIESYRIRYPHLIRCIIQSENQHSKGISTSMLAAEHCRSEYIALCEGDDYWISKTKIENQYQVILKDPTVSMVVSPGKLEVDGVIQSHLHCYYGDQLKEFSAQEVLNEVWQFAPTASYLLRKECLIKSSVVFGKTPVGDLFTELYTAVNGKLVYYPEVGSVYRMMAKNSWSERMSKNALANNIKFLNEMEAAIARTNKLPGFEDLDWSIKLSGIYYTLAVSYLKERDTKNFSNAIEKSYRYGIIARQQQLLYYCNKYIPALPMFIKPATYIKGGMKKLLKGFSS